MLMRPVKWFYAFLDNHVFPALIGFATHRIHISLMVCLWMALLLCGSFTAFELVGGNYTNGLSGLLGCIILMQQQKHQAATNELHDKVDALHQENRDLHQKLHHKFTEFMNAHANTDANANVNANVHTDAS